MKKIASCILFITSICILLVACDNKTISGFPNTVAVKEKTVIAIDIASQPQQEDYTRHYSDAIKIEEICDYIRRLTWNDLKDENPDMENGAEYSVT